MEPAPEIADDATRIAALAACGVLDTPPEERFDDLARLAASLAGTPVALVSLVDETRQWFKARHGLEETATPRSISFCGHAIASPGPLLVPDALADPRFADNPLVTGRPAVRFYYGVPLVLPEGHAVGTLCVIDHVPRTLDEITKQHLAALARQVVDQLVLRRQTARERALADQLRDKVEALREIHSLGLSTAQMDEAFPFHFALDPEMRLTRAGPGLRTICPWEPGETLGAHFVLRTPRIEPTHDEISAHTSSLFLLRARTGSFVLRGQFLPAEAEGHLLFLGSPWVTDLEQVKSLGLSISDFALHDSVSDLLVLMQARNASVEELNRLNRDLAAQREALRAANRRQTEVLRSALDAIITINGRSEIMAFNPAAQATFGWSEEEVVGRSLGEVIIPERFRDAHHGAMAHHLATGERRVLGKRVELPALRRDGTEFPVELSIVRTDVDGEPVFYGFLRDISDRRATEDAQREATEAAEAASRAKTDFLATMSHEIRTPMNAVLGMTEIALGSDSAEEVAECMTRVHRNAEALLGIINDILDVSKIEAGQFDLEARPFEVREVVEGAMEGVAARAEQKDLALLCFIEPDVPTMLVGDPNRLRQALVNLLGNAIKFTGSGEVRLAASVGDRDGRPTLQIEVADSGIGLSEAEAAHIFDKFWRSEKVRGYGGTGLGLNITQAVVSHMGGTIEVESELGVGSTFRVKLPLVLAPHEAATPIPSDAPTVLVVLQHDEARDQFARVLAARGFSVEAVTTAAGAETVLAGRVPGDTILLCALDDPAALGLAEAHRLGGGLVLGVAPLGAATPGMRRAASALIHRPLGPRSLISRLEEIAGVEAMDPRPSLSSLAGLRAARPRRVLVVEDTPDNQRFVAHVLGKMGYLVDIAENGAVAVERCEERDYDLVLMDVEMPVLDGLEATARIRSAEGRHDRERAPIVALTAHAMEGFRERCLAAGMDDYATKPLHRQRLVDLAQRWTDRRPVVLVVDDSPDNREILRRYIAKDGRFRAVTAAGGAQALEVLGRRDVDLAVVDMEMPGMDGVDLAGRIRSLKDGLAPLLLALTGRGDAATRERWKAAGGDSFLTKPVSRPTFLATLSEMLGAEPTVG